MTGGSQTVWQCGARHVFGNEAPKRVDGAGPPPAPASAASRKRRMAVLNSDLTALLRSVARALVLIRLSWDLMFATGS